MYVYNQVLISFCIESDCLSVSLSLIQKDVKICIHFKCFRFGTSHRELFSDLSSILTLTKTDIIFDESTTQTVFDILVTLIWLAFTDRKLGFTIEGFVSSHLRRTATKDESQLQIFSKHSHFWH